MKECVVWQKWSGTVFTKLILVSQARPLGSHFHVPLVPWTDSPSLYPPALMKPSWLWSQPCVVLFCGSWESLPCIKMTAVLRVTAMLTVITVYGVHLLQAITHLVHSKKYNAKLKLALIYYCTHLCYFECISAFTLRSMANCRARWVLDGALILVKQLNVECLTLFTLNNGFLQITEVIQATAVVVAPVNTALYK